MKTTEAFNVYNAIRLHFTSKTYSYFKYNGKTTISPESLHTRKDKYIFHKLARKYTDIDDLIDVLVCVFLKKDKIWVGDLLTKETEEYLEDFKKTFQSISYIFESECKLIFGDVDNPNKMLTTGGDYPELLKMAVRGDIHIETLCILNKILHFLPRWKSTITDDIVWPKYCMKVEKYSEFLPTDVTRFKMILRKIVV
jgi:hypothetical protein